MHANRFLVLFLLLRCGGHPVEGDALRRSTGRQRRRTRGDRGLQNGPSSPITASSLPTASPGSSSHSSSVAIIDDKKVKGPPKVPSYAQDFVSTCVVQLHPSASEPGSRLTNVEYGTFLLEYCSQSPLRGYACNSDGGTSSFTSLPVQLQLVFAPPSCSAATLNEIDQLQCLAELLEHGNGVFINDEPVDELCRETFPLLAATGLLARSPTTTPAPSVPLAAPVQSPALLPFTLEGTTDTSNAGSDAASTSDSSGSAVTNPTAPQPAAQPALSPISVQESREGDGPYTWPSTPSGSPKNSVPPLTAGRRLGAGSIVAAVLIGASLGGFVVTALWLRHKLQQDRIRRKFRKAGDRNDPDDDDDDDDDGLLGSGDGSVPSEYSCEIYLMEPSPMPAKSKSSTGGRWRQNSASANKDEDESEITMEFHKEVASEVTEEASWTRNDQMAVPPHEPTPVQSPAKYMSHPQSISAFHPSDIETCDNLQLSPISALSDPHHGHGAAPVEEEPRVVRTTRQVTRGPVPAAHPSTPCRWKPVPKRVPRSAAAYMTLLSPCVTAESTAELSSPASTFPSPTATQPPPLPTMPATATPATATTREVEDVESHVVGPSVLTRIQQFEKGLVLSPQTPSEAFERQRHAIPEHLLSPHTPHSTTTPGRDDFVGSATQSAFEALPIAEKAGDTVPEDHFLLDPVESPEVTSDVSDADSAEQQNDREDDDWTEETVSLDHAESEISEILEDQVAFQDDASFDEEEIVEEFVPIFVDQVPRDCVPKGWPKRRIDGKQHATPFTLFLPPLIGELGVVQPTEIADCGSPGSPMRTVREMVAAYGVKSPASPAYGKSPTSPPSGATRLGRRRSNVAPTGEP